MGKKRVIVIGGGASGLMSAIIAAREGALVTLLERNPRVGRKILATGNGRCNYTNINADINHYYGENTPFVYSSLAQFSSWATIDFFEELGVAHKIEDLGKVFPMSDQASSLLDVLRYELEDLKIKLFTEAFVTSIRKKGTNFEVKLKEGTTYIADRVIIATGGKALPASGSDGSGYSLAEKLGHTLIPPFPGLVQLKLEGDYFKQIQGVKFLGTAELIFQNKTLAKDRGDLLFTNYGISGPPILQLSRRANALFQKGEEVFLKISVIDNKSQEELRELLQRRFLARPEKTLEFSLVGLINKRLIPVILKKGGISQLKKPVKELSGKEKEKILKILQDWRFKIRGSRGWTSAQVTCGGIDTKEINPNTMESKIIPGLYFAGEVLDIDGECGGFNLQWAWSSGYVAGINSAKN